MVEKMTEAEIIKELVKIDDIENPWTRVYYWNLKKEYLSRMFQKNVFRDEYNHENEKELLKDINIKEVFKNLGR